MCRDCKAAKETGGLWKQFDSPKCIYCTARLIQRIGKVGFLAKEEVTARRRVVLADAIAWGHDETMIRKLAKGPLAISPEKAATR